MFVLSLMQGAGKTLKRVPCPHKLMKRVKHPEKRKQRQVCIMRNVVFVDGCRTGFGKLGGTIRKFPMTDLATIAVNGLLDKTQILERDGHVDGLYMGSAFTDCQSSTPARYVALKSKLGYDVWSSYVERQCGSAIDAINHAAAAIMVGNADVMIAGGGDSYSNMVAKFAMNVEPYKLIPPTPLKSSLAPDPADCVDMITISDTIARMYNITREECDEFAAASQQRAAAATEKGYFKDEIVPIVIPATKKTPEVVFDYDEFLRPGTTVEVLSKLRPVYPDGVTTAGNSSGRNDGAAMVLMMTEEKAAELGYKPFARFVAAGNSALDPKLMGLGPVKASLNALSHAGLSINDIDVWECNEAFAAQNLGVIRGLEEETGAKIDMANWNPNGGAISFGHPNGASGARIGIFTMKELERRQARYGLFTSCCGGGQGVTTIIENLRR